MKILFFLVGLLPTHWFDRPLNLDLSFRSSSTISTGIDTIVIRNATLDDAEEIADVVVSAFESSPVYRYIYQFRHEQRQYHFQCTRERIAGYIDRASRSDKLIFRVIDQPVNLDTNSQYAIPGKSRRVVSMALWAFLPLPDLRSTQAPLSDQILPIFPNTNAATLLSDEYPDTMFDCSKGLDQNATRAAHVNPQNAAAEKKYIYDAYDHQLYVAGMATHPDWDGHGFAAAHLRWGLSKAEAVGLNTTLIATPVGHPVYRSVGFEDVMNLTITAVPGDQEGPFWFEVMRAEP